LKTSERQYFPQLSTPSDEFLARLKEVSDGRFRIRWSVARGEYHIEQKVETAADLPIRISEIDDSLICARDGYWFVFAIRNGDRMACPACGLTIKVPVMEFKEAVCDHCRTKGRDGRYPAAFWPLNDRLIEHIRMIDPFRDDSAANLAERADEHNARMQASREREAFGEVEAVTAENFNRLVGIQQTGYTGKEAMWDHK
jgi:hypothetical protein